MCGHSHHTFIQAIVFMTRLHREEVLAHCNQAYFLKVACKHRLSENYCYQDAVRINQVQLNGYVYAVTSGSTFSGT